MNRNAPFAILLLFTLFWISCNTNVQQSSSVAPVPEGREEWRQMMRGGETDPAKVVAARKFLQKQLHGKSRFKDAGIGKWTNVGPSNFPGRIRAIAVHPTNNNIVYVGGATGGIWRSNDKGTTWTNASDFLPSLSITSILIDPTKPNIMYASTGEGFEQSGNHIPGAGILKSVNSGANWTVITGINDTNEDDFYWVNTIRFDPSDSNIIYAATSSGGQSGALGCTAKFFKITSGGGAVQELSFAAAASCVTHVMDIEIDPGNSNNIYLGTDIGLLHSTDAGTTWSNVNNDVATFPALSGRVEIEIAETNTQVIYALCELPNNGNLFKSTNGGMTWTNVTGDAYNFFAHPSLGNNAGYHSVLWVDPLDEDNLICGGIDLWRSVNGALWFNQISKWQEYQNGLSAHADHHVIQPASDYSSSNRKLYFGNDGGLATTSNFLTVSMMSGWNLLPTTTLGITQFYHSSSAGGNFLGGTQDQGTLEGAGASWNFVLGGDGGYCGRIDHNSYYFSYQNGNFFLTDDDGATIHQIASLSNDTLFNPKGGCAPLMIDDDAPFITVMHMFPTNRNKLILGGKRLWYSDNSGCNWVEKTPTGHAVNGAVRITSMEVTPNNENLVIVGFSSGEMYKADISGMTWTWTKIAGSNFNNIIGGPITDIAVSPVNNDMIAASKGGYIDDNLWISTDGGATWNERSNGIPSIQINAVVWHPQLATWLYAGTDLGVMATENSGHNWGISSLYNESEGPAYTEITELYFISEANLVATTFGRGIWRSNRLSKDVYVDQNYMSVVRLGTMANPYNSLQEAIDNYGHGSNIIFLSNGMHDEAPGNVLLDKRGLIKVENGSVIIE